MGTATRPTNDLREHHHPRGAPLRLPDLHVVEGVRELLRVRPVAVSEARVIGRDKVTPIGKPGEERLEHPRGRWKSVQEQNRRRFSWSSLSVEDGDPINLCCAIKGRVFQGKFLSLRSSERQNDASIASAPHAM